ncbi:hypothetical protein Poli38472_002983 [Pythium oligandrum]|uniref:Uncharacterized protein n=1 Tax=Pythium oligandrum TaxID=41045 RepID=A0A8K1FFQ9_PYTOL|nr:hypothetical protein Poli38472_002983 [Pythium oligandrum]|eukprot:TMW57058.1 hypothetical protein Poli38472_002983 [Pythium oligandrum]
MPAGENTYYVGLINAYSLPAPWAGKAFSSDAGTNLASFTQAFRELPQADQNIRKMMDPVGPDCGYTAIDGEPVDVSWRHDLKWMNTGDPGTAGFVPSHTGPCEVWIDETMVLHEDNCAGKFTGLPASIPVDYSKCSGTCTLRFYWLALHEPNWQVYKNCVKIKNGGRRMLRE